MTQLASLATQIQENVARFDDLQPPKDVGAGFASQNQTLDLTSETARGQLLVNLEQAQRLLLSPKDRMQRLYYESAEAGVVLALCQLGVPRAIPLDRSITYEELSGRTGVSEDRLRHLVRNAIVCSDFLAEDDGKVAHSQTSAAWHLDEAMAAGFEVMQENLPASSLRLGESCSKDPTDGDDKTCGFSVLHDGQSLYQWLESDPAQRAKFAGHMRSQSSIHGDDAVRAGYDWSSLKGKTLVDCGGSFGSVAAAIIGGEPDMHCIVQDLPRVIESAKKAAGKLPQQIEFRPQSFFDAQETVADAYLFRQVFLNHPDVSARKILQALRPALRPGARLIVIEYVMPGLGTAPVYAEVAARRLDNAMYCLMKGKIRELEEFKALVAEEVPELTFWSFKQGEMRATHDPRSHCVLEWRMKE